MIKYLIACALLSATQVSASDTASVAVESGKINLRSQPCGKSDIGGIYAKETRLEVTNWNISSTCGGDEVWAQVNVEGRIGYMAQKHLRKWTKTWKARINNPSGGKVNVRSEPCLPSDGVGQVNHSDHALVLERGIQSTCGDNVWAKVTASGIMGYVNEDLLIYEEEAPTPITRLKADNEETTSESAR